MIKFKKLNEIGMLDNKEILLFEYFYHDKNLKLGYENTFSYKGKPFKRECNVVVNIKEVVDSIYEFGEMLFEFLQTQKKFNLEYRDLSENRLSYLRVELEACVDDWVLENGFPFFRGFPKHIDDQRVYELYNLNIFLFVKSAVNLYLSLKTHKLIYLIESLDSRDETSDKQILTQLNEFKDYFLTFGYDFRYNMYSLNVPNKMNKLPRQMKYKDYYLPEKDEIDISSWLPMVFTSKNDEEKEKNIQILDLKNLNDSITEENWKDVISTLKGLNLLLNYQFTHETKYEESIYNYENIESAFSYGLKIDYDSIIYDKDLDRYQSHLMSYSLIGIAYHQLLLNLTSYFVNEGSNTIPCANPNCNNRFEKKGQKKYCDNPECQAYRNNLKSRNCYNKKKKLI